jgi:hypothetical protein
MNTIEEVRRRRENLANVLKENVGIRRIVEDLYPDNAHFIYELLQNAEDTGATEAHFHLTKMGLAFEHNGRSFDRDDIFGITAIGEGTKAADDDKIGRFGIGFKAVFAYSETPHIWSPTFCFKITDLVLPNALPTRPGQNGKTRFEFPFNNPKKAADIAYGEVEIGLKGLAEMTLLFLPHLESISWEIEGESPGEVLRIQHSEYHFEVLKQSGGRTTISSHFLKFDRPIEGLERQRAAVAYPLDFLPNVEKFDPKTPLAKQLKIIPASPGHVAVFFPAEKETSGLRFHLHAPFVPELSRASIKETPANRPLFKQLAVLTTASLYHIRDLGLLTADFLAVLPNPQDQIPARYECIRSAIVQEMNTQPLTPTYARDHAPAKYLLQGKAALKELLSEDDLEFLVDYDEEPPRWAISAPQRNSNADRFLSGLAIKEWDIDKFVKFLSTKLDNGSHRISSPPYWLTGPDPEAAAWLARQSVEWHQRFYSLLSAELSTTYELSRVVKSRIVRLAGGTYGIGSECFFPGDGLEEDEVLPRVAIGVYTSGKGKAQQENARKFLESIGVREVGEKEQVEALLNQRYTAAELKPRKQDLLRFISLVEKDPSSVKLFADYYIFERKDGKWGKPAQVFLDEPFLNTGLQAYYDGLGPNSPCVALADSYIGGGRPSPNRIAKFAAVVGAQTALPVECVPCYENPKWPYLAAVGGERFTSPINNDFVIPGLSELLLKPSLMLSKLIWRTLCELRPVYLVATFQRNQRGGARYAESQLVHHLRAAAWVPQRGGSFVRPAEASRELLPEGFAFDPGWKWIKDVQFGAEVVKRSEEQRQKQAVAKELGFTDSAALERAKRFVALPPEEQERILADRERLNALELPENTPANPARRAERVGAEARDAAGRITEERTHSVSVGLAKVKEEAAAYLRLQYTNADGNTICQICKAPLPFKLDDGSYYFEKVEFLPELKKRHYQNYLALCPNHAAMYQHANGSSVELNTLFCDLTENTLHIVLAQMETSIYFTKTHLADLNAVIEAEESKTETVNA